MSYYQERIRETAAGLGRVGVNARLALQEGDRRAEGLQFLQNGCVDVKHPELPTAQSLEQASL